MSRPAGLLEGRRALKRSRARNARQAFLERRQELLEAQQREEERLAALPKEELPEAWLDRGQRRALQRLLGQRLKVARVGLLPRARWQRPAEYDGRRPPVRVARRLREEKHERSSVGEGSSG
jgi:hypothetical protein